MSVRDGTFIIGRRDRRRDEGPRPPPGAERRRGGRGYLELGHPTVSQAHAELVVLNGTYYLSDLGSTNGTWIVRGGRSERHDEGYVDLDTPLQLGDCPCTIRQLLRHVDAASRD